MRRKGNIVDLGQVYDVGVADASRLREDILDNVSARFVV